MASSYDSIKYFMDNYLVYDNPHDVEIITTDDDSVTVAASWPGEANDDGYNLEIFFECATLEEFIITFKLRSAHDLLRITPDFMMHLYEQGKAEICCAVDSDLSYYPMQFRKLNNTIVATDDYDNEHEVPVVLKTPQQFRDYTRQCFALANVNI